MINKISVFFFWFFLAAYLLQGTGGNAEASDTMLMFVGEDLEVLSIASRRKEAAWSAPAVAGVVTKDEIDEKGAFTIAQALADTPGFYMNQTEKGHTPFLRGIENSALFLFDTLPMGSGIRKSDTMIDHETSLAAVKRIEVVRGTGSVLWGPNAFAGVVNVVPMTGRDLEGIQTGLILSSPNDPGEAFLNYGLDNGNWTTFFSFSGRQANEDDDAVNVVRFWSDGIAPEPPTTRFGQNAIDDSRYINVYGSATLEDWLTLSMKINDSRNAYTAHDWDHVFAWEEQINSRSSFIKLEAARKLSLDSGIRFTGYYSETREDQTVVDLKLNQDSNSWYGELIYDREFFHAKGLLTLGSSLRRDEAEQVPLWDSFYPDFFVPQNQYLLPLVHQVDIKNNLISAFTQYQHDFDDFQVWAGARYDDHDLFDDKISTNAGLAWDWGQFRFKTLYGTAYRTPFARQIRNDGQGTLEKISNYNAQVSWRTPDTRASMTLFKNEIEGHVVEDRYAGAGLSSPNKQTINGVEFEVEQNVTDHLKLSANFTLLDNSGPNETYFYLSQSFPEDVFLERSYAYNTGPKAMGSLKATWQISDKVTLVPELHYFSRRTLYYPKEDISKSCSEAWVGDLNLMVKGAFPFDMFIHLNNIFDTDYTSPGLYSVTRSQGFSAGMMFRMNW